MMGIPFSKRTRLVMVISVVAAAVVAAYGLDWIQERSCTRIDFRGLDQADVASLHRLAHPADSTYKAALVADRVRRHPWVRWSTAVCYPTGRLVLTVEERVPVMLVTDAAGRMSHFIDPAGFMMPVTEHSVFDVPLLRNVDEPYHPVRPVAHPAIRELVQTLALLDDETDRLVSEFAVTPDGLKLYTEPVNGGAPVEVWLGREGFSERLQRFRSFWEQRVRTHPARAIQRIDLRFAGQIVTREASI